MLRWLWWGFCFPSNWHNTLAVLAIHSRLHYLFPPNVAAHTSLTRNCGRREKCRLEKEQRDGKKRLEEALIQETGRLWHKDEKQSSGSPQGLGSMCTHNEGSQTYPASLISTIKAIFSAQHTATSSAICKSPHLSPKIKTSQKKARLVKKYPEEEAFQRNILGKKVKALLPKHNQSEETPKT